MSVEIAFHFYNNVELDLDSLENRNGFLRYENIKLDSKIT